MKENHLFFGFSYWKHDFIKPFFSADIELVFINSWFGKNVLALASKKGLNAESTIYIWGKKSFPDVEAYALKHQLKVVRIEDGFIRSVSLGSDLTQPLSLVVDTRGIYFDPTVESDLEHLLNTYTFDDEILKRAGKLRKKLIREKISKYNSYENRKIETPKDKKIVLVPGQVEDDASLQFGAEGMSNLELLQETRKNAPEAFIIFKPHPDVLVGNRVGNVADEVALGYCDRVVKEVSLDSVLAIADEVHTMTSLVGFEALMYGKKVYTYGMPFYASWGLSIDKKSLSRRKRTLDINMLVAATLLLYPKYYNPETHALCEAEEVMKVIAAERERYKNSAYKRKMMLRNFFLRKIQLLIRIAKIRL